MLRADYVFRHACRLFYATLAFAAPRYRALFSPMPSRFFFRLPALASAITAFRRVAEIDDALMFSFLFQPIRHFQPRRLPLFSIISPRLPQPSICRNVVIVATPSKKCLLLAAQSDARARARAAPYNT